MATKSKRKQYLIDSNFQIKFILKFCLVVVLSSLLVVGLLLFLAKDSTTVAIENTQVLVKNTADFILPLTISAVLIGMLFSGGVVLILTLFTSHKISGPLYRLKNEVDNLTKGDFKRNFYIRGDDQLQNFSQSLDQMCNSLRDKHLALRNKYQYLKDYLEDKQFSLSDENKEEAAKALNDLGEELSGFKL
ncbi:MAG: methyl-accepting chemotaxis protein [Candidatus Omnitrophica bacterium]|nr:methyl-accepting chemotaxis protein [Candidatus Omnitrophota bacterium]